MDNTAWNRVEIMQRLADLSDNAPCFTLSAERKEIALGFYTTELEINPGDITSAIGLLYRR
jgi:hypothetical protein